MKGGPGGVMVGGRSPDLSCSSWWSAEDWEGKAGNTPIIQAGGDCRWSEPTQTCQLTPTQTGVEEQNILSQSFVFYTIRKLYFNFSKFRLRPKTFQSLKYHLIINWCLLQWETCEATDAATPRISHFSGKTLEADLRYERTSNIIQLYQTW